MGRDVFNRTAWLDNQPDGVVYFGSFACGYKGESPVTIQIAEGTTHIAEWAFCYLDSLVSVTIPNSITAISASSFAGCSSLSKVVIPNSVTTIDSLAFARCTGLSRVDIPISVTAVNRKAFEDCPNLTIYGVKESAAHQYAVENKITFKEL